MNGDKINEEIEKNSEDTGEEQTAVITFDNDMEEPKKKVRKTKAKKQKNIKKTDKGGKSHTTGLVISVAAVSVAVTFIITSFVMLQLFNNKIENVNSLSKTYSELKELDDTVRDNYYGKISDSDMQDGVLKGYVSGLGDKYSEYLTPTEYSDSKTREEGNSTGIGITVTKNADGYMQIKAIEKEGPAADANIKVDDVIVAVDGNDVVDAGYENSVDSIRGEDGTSVDLTIMRDNETFNVTVTRKTFEVTTVHSTMLANHIGYIKIDAFRTTTINQFLTALSDLESQGAAGFIFDVRDNGGGLLSSCQSILDPLLPEGDIAVANYAGGDQETIITSDKQYLDLPMVVLVNENTASAAELFACSLRDFAKAKLVGVQTYGKGVMQNTFPLSNGGAVTVTIATYQTTKSDCYDGVGLIPDKEVKSDSGDNITSMNPDEDAQLLAAIELLK